MTADVSTDLRKIITAMADKAVLVVGDIMLDKFVYGDVQRISPESPVPVLSVAREEAMLGGAGNVLSNLAGLGCKQHLLSVIGADDAGEQVRMLVAEHDVDSSGLIVDPDRLTTIKSRFLASHQQLLRTDSEKVVAVSSDIEKGLLEKAQALIKDVQAVVLSDYGKGVLSEAVIRGIIKMANKAAVPVLVDPKKADYGLYKGADVVTPNRKELSEATGGAPTKTDDEVVAAAQELINQSGVGAVVATRSQDGMSIIRRAAGLGKKFEAPVHLRSGALEVFDVSGAGDTVIATIAAALAAEASLSAAAALANVAGGIVVAKVGTAPIRAQEILEQLDDRGDGWHGSIHDARLCDWDEAAEQVRRWQARGLRVGFTNGCFDILHPGHVGYLNMARGRCDRLVVAINEDESIKRLKGSERPLNDAASRVAVLGGLGAVDMTVLFGATKEEDDKASLVIDRLRPDIYFKGGDYTIDQLPEAPVVQAYGGTVEIMPLAEGHSTTATIEKMKKSNAA